jgi:hypothetical protein
MKQVPGRNDIKPIPRIPADFRVDLTAGRRKIRCLARELSEFGISLVSAHTGLVGKNVSLHLIFEKPDSSLSLSGTVFSATKDCLEIRFREMSPEQQAQLTSYVHARGIGIARAENGSAFSTRPSAEN